MKEQYMCHSCGTKYNITEMIWKCKCGGLLDLKKEKGEINPEEWKKGQGTMWRYVSSMPFSEECSIWKTITMGEGYTPLIRLDENVPYTFVKVDYMMPTLSFKDRGAAVLMAKAKELGVTKVIADSSGNAGTSIAAYARRAGIPCDVFLSEATSPKKIAQIKAHGANVRAIQGTREEVASAAQEAVELEKVFYGSHVYNPFFYEGTKTYAYELFEQSQEFPDALIIPAGNGTLLLGTYYGLKELQECKLIHKLPKLIAVQAENCSPLADSFSDNEKQERKGTKETVAEGIAIAAPARALQILKAVRATDGQFITVAEEEIQKARVELAHKGFYVEPTTAANYAGYSKYEGAKSERIVIPLCGAGIKGDK